MISLILFLFNPNFINWGKLALPRESIEDILLSDSHNICNFFALKSDKASIDGLAYLPFIISRNANINDLPSSHTCFNHLVLPNYLNKNVMEKKLKYAIDYSEGFGLQ